jgi:hypothetical protein
MFTSFFICRIISFKKILKKEDLQYGKHNKKFNEDYQPYLFTPARHIAESLIIKTVNTAEYGKILSHSTDHFFLK